MANICNPRNMQIQSSCLMKRIDLTQVAWWARGFADFDFKWYQSAPLPLPLAGEMLTADMAVSSSGLIRVLVVSHLKPSQAVILTVSGNPTVLPPDGVTPNQPALFVMFPQIFVAPFLAIPFTEPTFGSVQKSHMRSCAVNKQPFWVSLIQISQSLRQSSSLILQVKKYCCPQTACANRVDTDAIWST